MKSFAEIRDDLNSVELLPKAVLSLSTHNKKTGKSGGEKSVTLSFSVTLWHLICCAAAAFAAMQVLGVIRALAEKGRIDRKVKAALKKEREAAEGTKEA